MIMKKFLAIIFCATTLITTKSQVGIGNDTPQGLIDVNDNPGGDATYGMVVPITTDPTTLIDPVTTDPTIVEGTIAYDKTQHCLKYYGENGWSGCLSDRKVHEGNLTINTDAEFDELVKEKYVEINGTLMINGASLTITNLKGLESITTVESLIINTTENLLNLEGLNNLTKIRQNLKVMRNTAIQSMEGLGFLVSIPNIRIDTNPNLEDFTGLDNLTNSEQIIVLDNGITSAKGLGSLIKVKTIGFYGNHNLLTLDGAESLGAIDSSATFEDNKALRDYCAISQAIGSYLPSTLSISQNAYNPTRQDIIDGNCSDLP